MLQAIVKKGKVLPDNIPAPDVNDNSVLIRVVNSCISAGTEMSRISDSGRPLLQKVLDKPEKIIKAIDLVKSQGIASFMDKLNGASESVTPIGYSIAGIVLKVGKDVKGFKPGDYVAAAGAGYANHAEIVSVPENLVVKMPQDMEFKEASTVGVGVIAMHGIRRVDAKLGEYCVVIGTGILGLLAIQMLKGSGVRVAAIDLDEKRLTIAKDLGAELVINPSSEDNVKAIENWSGGHGVDAVMFTAATGSSEPLSQAFKMCKRKGKVVLVGVSGMTINRDDIYAKEIDFQISTSYGPGRYDKSYEEEGSDYPYAYVRWTENRNMSEYLRLVHCKAIQLNKLITAVFPANKTTEAFESLKKATNKPIIALLDYGKPDDFSTINPERIVTINPRKKVAKNIINVALVGAGSFATTVHLPNIRKMQDKYSLHTVVDQNGLVAKAVAVQFGAQYATTDFDQMIKDQEIDLVLIATRHKSHAELALKALNAGKNVFVEKPLAINEEQLSTIEMFYNKNSEKPPLLMVGFNRRFSKYAQEIKNHTDKRINPLFMHYRMNAGYLPLNHWVHEDGGRIIGEGCHIIDLMSFFANSKVKSISYESLGQTTNKYSDSDNKSITISYENGSIATIEYFAVGNKAIPKEFFEVHFDEKTIIMEDYKKLFGYGLKVKQIDTKNSEKGHYEELNKLHNVLIGKDPKWPIPLDCLIETTRTAYLLSK